MSASAQEPRISVRIPKQSDLKQRLAAAAQRTGVPESLLVLRAIEAVVSYIEASGRIAFPLEVQEPAGSPGNPPQRHRRTGRDG